MPTVCRHCCRRIVGKSSVFKKIFFMSIDAGSTDIPTEVQADPTEPGEQIEIEIGASTVQSMTWSA